MTKLLCLGDSLTYGYGVTRQHSWFYLLRKELSIPMVNCGRNGAGLWDLLQNFQGVCSENPSHVLLFAGMNDLIQGRKARDLLTKIQDFLLLAESRGFTPLLATLISPRAHAIDTWWIPAYGYEDIKKEVALFNAALRSLSKEENLLLFDLDELFKMEKDELFLDGIHPGATGHAIIAAYIKELLMKA